MALFFGFWLFFSVSHSYLQHTRTQANDVVYVMGTYDSPCERHLYALPLTNPLGGPGGSGKPVRLTQTPCMHNVIMDHRLRRWEGRLWNGREGERRVWSVLVVAVRYFCFSTSKRKQQIPGKLKASPARLAVCVLRCFCFFSTRDSHGVILYQVVFIFYL